MIKGKRLPIFIILLFGLTSCQIEKYEPIDSKASHIIAVNLLEKSLSFFDEKTRKEVAKWEMPFTFTGAELLPDQKTLLLYGKHLKNIYLYDLTTGRKVDQWKIGKGIAKIKTSNDQSKLYLANQEKNTIEVRTLEGEKLKEIKVGHSPLTILENDKRNELYIMNFHDPYMTVIDLNNLEKIKELPAKTAAVGAVVIESLDELWTGGHGSHQAENEVTVYSLETGNIKQLIPAPIMPVDLEQLGNYIYVISHGSNELRKIDIMTKEVVQTIEIGANPFEISIINNLLYIASYDSNEIIINDPVTLEVIETLKAGKGPFQILYKNGGVKHG
ncbi:YncE family protein [Calidifontibacillus erzurumensis]|uniref:WD40 repeat domain-containing protein n=1 Tax=Calidifontibacillus erzurumensis TaxID=2741433 RepID=A0A8J8GDR7_9BACI|nr:WD40 repeat domain-containing protein [Calidifontibacillus erzurumensis]NSL51659.1 WD40 repeat domain-containing protein [Calidifontibacillus erzurumensis]